MIPPLTKWINDIKVKLGFSRTMTAAGADVVDAVNKHSDQIANLQNGLAYVENGDNATLRTYTAGEYLVWKGVLYTVNSGGIPQYDPITGHVTAVTDGGFNMIKSSFDIVSGSATPESVLSNDSVIRFEKTNHVVTGTMSIYPTSALAANVLLASGLPSPRANRYFILGNTDVIRLYINASGQIKTDGAISTANIWYNGMFCYLTEE